MYIIFINGLRVITLFSAETATIIHEQHECITYMFVFLRKQHLNIQINHKLMTLLNNFIFNSSAHYVLQVI